MDRKCARGLIAAASLLLLLTGLLIFGRRLAGSIRFAEGRRWKECAGEIYASVPFGAYQQETVSLWWSDEESKYYLFLPSFWDEDKPIRLREASGRLLYLDGEALPASGRLKELRVGEHELRLEEESYLLEVMASENIPSVFLDMENDKKDALHQIPYQEQVGADMLVVRADGSVEAEGSVDGIRVRGNTSADWVKKPYQVTMSQTTDFFGMGSAVKWTLLSNWSDKTLLRNQIAYGMGAEAGLPYSPQSQLVDLYLNGEYQGNYQLCEKVEIGKNRVNIENLADYTSYEPTAQELDIEASKELAKEDPAAAGIVELDNGIRYRGYQTYLATEDITGGYLLEIERPSRIYESPSFFITAKGQPVTVKSPKYADEKQVVYIAGLWQSFEDALYAEDGINPGTGLHYTEYIDMESFVKKYLVEEIVRNYDASSTSQYFYKDVDAADERIFAGPVWDYDMSLGNPIMNPLTNQHYISSVSPYGLFAALPMDDFSIWYHLYEKEEFRQAVVQSYEQDFLPYLRALHSGKIEEMADEITASALMDGVRWNKNDSVTPEGRKQEYQTQVENLKDFVRTREHYLTGLWLEGRESKRVYLDGGNADMYISYVEGLVGDVLEEPIAPVMEGYTFVQWLDGYTREPYDFTKPYDGSDLYFVAEYKSDADGSSLIAGE